MRLFPVVGSGTTRRNLERDMWVGGGKLFVPRGVLVWIPMHAVQNVAANWDQPDQFQPERWSQVSLASTTSSDSAGLSSTTYKGKMKKTAFSETFHCI